MKAIDIAILLPDEITELAIKLNKNLVGPKNIQLNTKDQIPHITLLFGGADEQNLEEIHGKVLSITKQFPQLNLTISNIRYGGSTGLHITKTEQLINLQTKLVEEISPILNYKTTPKMYAGYPNIIEKTTGWVNNYPNISLGGNYDPHITIGDGKLDLEHLPKLPIKFKADAIAICHLGNLCTCNKILYRIQL